MKLINWVPFAIIYINITNRKMDPKDPSQIKIIFAGWLPSGWLPFGWLPFWWLPCRLAAFGMLCGCSAWCLDMLAIMYVAVRGQLINNN